MPKYAVDFLAEIQELTSATTNLDECSDSADLLTTLPHFGVPVERACDDYNAVNAPMGNAQCCFRRYPGYEAHRHVVVSRGVQCSDAILKRVVDSEFDSLGPADHRRGFRSPMTERGDALCQPPLLLPPSDRSPDNESGPPLKISVNPCKGGAVHKRKPDVFTPVTHEPPELRESAKFFRKMFPNDFKRNRKFFDDDIDSLSATISNYSLHEKLLRLEENATAAAATTDNVIEVIDQNNHKLSRNVAHLIPIFQQRETEFKGSTEALKGSLTRSLTLKTTQMMSPAGRRTAGQENASSESYTSLGGGGGGGGNVRDNKSTFVTNSGDNTQDNTNAEDAAADRRRVPSQTNLANSGPTQTERSAHPTPPPPPVPVSGATSGGQMQTFSRVQTGGRPRSLLTGSVERHHARLESPPCVAERTGPSKAVLAASVTFMRGSEELRKGDEQKLSETDTLNALRKKQKFLMKHTRTNSRLATTLSNPESGVAPSSDPLAVHNERTESYRAPKTPDYSPVPPTEATVPKSPPPRNPSSLGGPFGAAESGRNASLSRTSSHSENASHTPNQNQSTKVKRTVSFDRAQSSGGGGDRSCLDGGPPTAADSANQACSRNNVRSKYCTKKVVRHKFYVPESANIEQILRDPSDRRIKAICDRHNCDIEIYSKVPKSGFLKNIIILAAPNNESLRKCVRSLDYSMRWCLTAQLT